MKTEYIIYHNPRWGKSRRSVQILEENNLIFKVIKYLEDPPSKEELLAISKALKLKPDKFIRKSEKIYSDLNVQNFLTNPEKLFSLIVENPILLERPIIVKGKRGVIGRPPENILSLL